MAFTALLMAYYRQSKLADGRVPEHADGAALLGGVDGENPKRGDGRRAAVV